MFQSKIFLLQNPKTRDKLRRNIYNFWFRKRSENQWVVFIFGVSFSFSPYLTLLSYSTAGDPPGLLSQIS